MEVGSAFKMSSGRNILQQVPRATFFSVLLNIFYWSLKHNLWKTAFWRRLIVFLILLALLKSHLKKDIQKITNNTGFLILFCSQIFHPRPHCQQMFLLWKRFGDSTYGRLWALSGQCCNVSWAGICPATRFSLPWSKMKTLPRHPYTRTGNYRVCNQQPCLLLSMHIESMKHMDNLFSWKA